MQTQTITVNSNHANVERLYGFSINEDSSAAAVVEFRAGSATGQIVIGPLSLSADQSALIGMPKAVFWEFPGGCYIKEVSGSVAGALHY